MRRILVLALAVCLICMADLAWAAGSDDIFVTVSLESIVSVDITPGSWNIGAIILGGGPYTSVTFLATNDGNVTEDFSIKASDAVNGWILGEVPGTDTFRVTELLSVFTLMTSDQMFTTNVIPYGTAQLQFQYDPPTADTQGGGVDHSFTITITASESP